MDNVREPRGVLLDAHKDFDKTLESIKALASGPRLRILNLLNNQPLSVSEIAKELGLHLSTVTLHIAALEKAGLLIAEHKPAKRGTQKLCARNYTQINLELSPRSHTVGSTLELSMPIGSYVDFTATPTCGLLTGTSIIGLLDDPASFYEPERIQAQLLWFHQGHVEYRFPNRLPPGAKLTSLQLSMEICSEAPLHHGDWPSDITVWINGTDIGHWTSPADFADRRGKLTPSWWLDHNSQYGLLKIWRVTPEGSSVDGLKISDITLEDINISRQNHIAVSIGVKEDAKYVGGINIFGREFGNYPQDIVLHLQYS